MNAVALSRPTCDGPAGETRRKALEGMITYLIGFLAIMLWIIPPLLFFRKELWAWFDNRFL